MNDGPTWQDVYALPEALAAGERFRATREPAWLSLGRGLARRLGIDGEVAPGERPEVEPERLPPATVFVLGATGSEAPTASCSGCLGHVAADGTGGLLAGGEIRIAGAAVREAGAVIDAVRDAVVSELRGLDAAVRVPGVDLVVPSIGEGDSHALAAALAVLHGVWGEPTATGLAATGGFDLERRRFTTVPAVTLASKIEAARRWGIRTLVVLDGQEIPDEVELGPLEVLRVSSDPARLSLAVLGLASRRPGELSRSLVHQALWQYDVRVARAPATTAESVFAVTRAFVEGAGVEAGASADVPTALSPDADPIAWLLACDLRSRAMLHAGDGAEAVRWSRLAGLGWGRGDLPTGGLGDLLRYQRVAHESMLEVDLGHVADNAGGGAHARLDQTISRLDGTWCTTHERLHRVFLANTRWRRRLHLARLILDPAPLEAAWRDLVEDRARWPDLLAVHADRRLGMADTTLARQYNYVLEHLATRRLMALVEASPASDRLVGLDATAEAVDPLRFDDTLWFDESLRLESMRRVASIERLGGFDLRGLLQAVWLGLPVEDDVWPRLLARVETLGAGGTVEAARAADWLVRFERVDPAVSTAILARAVQEVRTSATQGIRNLMSLRWAALVRGRDRASIEGAALAEDVPRPSSASTLAETYDDLLATPTLLLVRTPY